MTETLGTDVSEILILFPGNLGLFFWYMKGIAVGTKCIV